MTKAGKVIFRKQLSPLLEIIRIAPEEGKFPDYTAGQYIALTRENCRLTRKVSEAGGTVSYTYAYDDAGNIKRGQVSHSYSIASAPTVTRRSGYLEFYIILDLVKMEFPGRLSESLFHADPENDNKIWYTEKITGTFTFERRTKGFDQVVMVAMGTGLAPFVSMVRELHEEALAGRVTPKQVTLFHTNRTFRELGYHEELREIERLRAFDFAYVPTVSRPTERDRADAGLGTGRANNVLRTLFDMPLMEAEIAAELREAGEDATYEERRLERTTPPVLPASASREKLLLRMAPEKAVMMTCGNPAAMADIECIARKRGMRFEKEEW